MAYDPAAEFPNLSRTKWRELERPNDRYNCIAYALGVTNRRWWPALPRFYWPPTAPTLAIKSSFANVFATLGYEPCDSGNLEEGYEKLALYEKMGFVKHAARQMPDGSWRSKLGVQQLIEHELSGLEGNSYGYVTTFYRRAVTT